jgi:threonine dehydratase
LEARDNLHPEIIRTPLQIWRHGSTVTDKIVQVKLETLQRTGSYKARGSWNRLRLLRPAERKAGVICVSAGNHAQGVALASHLLRIKATIVMPETTPQIKVIQTKLYGQPEVVICGKNLSEASQRAWDLQRDRGLIFIHPYDDDAVIAGQGTIGLEILEQWPDVDTIIVPVGGGGLIAGIAVAVLTHHSDIRVIGVQSERADSGARAVECWERVILEETRTIADGINVRQIGERPFQILMNFGIPIMRVTEEEICFAITALCQTAKLVVEPAGAVSAAAALFHSEKLSPGRKIVCILSGANINISSFAEILKTHPTVM